MIDFGPARNGDLFNFEGGLTEGDGTDILIKGATFSSAASLSSSALAADMPVTTLKIGRSRVVVGQGGFTGAR